MADNSVLHDVFVSYNRSDATEAEMLATRLSQKAGLRVWLDKARLQQFVESELRPSALF